MLACDLIWFISFSVYISLTKYKSITCFSYLEQKRRVQRDTSLPPVPSNLGRTLNNAPTFSNSLSSHNRASVGM